MDFKELRERIIDFSVDNLNFDCLEISCEDCPFNINMLCNGKYGDYHWDKIKESNIPDDVEVTLETVEEFKKLA